VIRFFGGNGDDRLLLVNFQTDLQQRVCPEPLLAPSIGTEWKVMFSTEDPRFGGLGVYTPNADGPWIIPGETAVLMKPEAHGANKQGDAEDSASRAPTANKGNGKPGRRNGG
jgi:maltooligosyltrehalose trehalohydrolase